jgi:phosphoribosyl 1,2-cyclic phosphate phosphodiesterase
MLLVDDQLLVDCGPDLYALSAKHDLDLSAVRTLLLTHQHSDHLYMPNLEYRQEGFCPTTLPTLEVFGSPDAMALIRECGYTEEAMRLRTHATGPFAPWEIDGYRVTALRARHARPPVEPYLYVIEGPGASILYAHDTGLFPAETWDYLTNPPNGRRHVFDLVSMDATNGLLADPGDHHLSLSQVAAHRDRLAEAGLLRPGARIFANHFSHNGTPAHGDLVRHLDGSGIEAAYDGLMVEI